MADQVDVLHRLDAHHPDQRSVRLVAPEHDACGDLTLQLLPVDVRLAPAILRDHPAVGLCGCVDDR
jgi:hypothetical protein